MVPCYNCHIMGSRGVEKQGESRLQRGSSFKAREVDSSRCHVVKILVAGFTFSAKSEQIYIQASSKNSKGLFPLDLNACPVFVRNSQPILD